VQIVEWCGDFLYFNVEHAVASCKTEHVVGTATERGFVLFCIVFVLTVSLK
jgi:hypothetical protein